VKKGFSLLEVLLAMAVIVVGLFAIVGSVIYSLRMEARAGHATEALFYANQLVDLSKLYNLPKNSPIVDVATARTAVSAAPYSSEVKPNTNYTRNIQMNWVNPSATDYRNELYQVDVSVYWMEQGHEESVRVSALHRAP
jgi:prepilin-type N-terminal cleavage/methylation domain-containing protein